MPILSPRCDVVVEVVGRVRKGREDDNLVVSGVDWRLALRSDEPFQFLELVVSRRVDIACLTQEPSELGLVFFEFLLPSYAVHVLEQDLDLVADQIGVELGVLDFNVLDIELLNVVAFVRFDSPKEFLNTVEQAFKREGKGVDPVTRKP